MFRADIAHQCAAFWRRIFLAGLKCRQMPIIRLTLSVPSKLSAP